MENVNVGALFLGPKSENGEFFKEMLNFMISDHIDWRRFFHPEDHIALSPEEQELDDYKKTLLKTRQVLTDLAGRLQIESMPWFSPRYLGHMNADTLIAANLAFMLTLLYNPNNCAYEGSPATTAMEIEVGRQLAAMLGFDPQHAWGHITSGGTIANFEGLWAARCLKSVPQATKRFMPELVQGFGDFALLNLPTGRILDLVDQVRQAGRLEDLRRFSVRGAGMSSYELGKLLVPQSKHYSWVKAVDVLGIGQENLVYIQVTKDYRMDLDHLKETIDHLVEERTPILGVVAVTGTTEEGAVDEVHRVVALRKEYEKSGISFYIHVDAAYGGYGRTLFLDEEGGFMEYGTLTRTLHEMGLVDESTNWPDSDVYEAFKATGEVDSITIDPHKMGYIPYPAGAVLMKDRRVLDLISYSAPYVEDKARPDAMTLGSYIMEGSKAGAAVAAVWAAHQLVPLNITGYGKLVGSSIEGGQRFYHALVEQGELEADGRIFSVAPLCKPDFNLVVFAFNERGNESLEHMNHLNQKMYELCSYKSGPVYRKNFITSKTILGYEDYGDAPWALACRLGIPEDEWQRVRSLFVLRSAVVTPFLAGHVNFEQYWQGFLDAIRLKLARAAQDIPT